MKLPARVRRAKTSTKPFLRWDTWLVAVLAFVPLLFARHGLLTDDTKIYLYLDPGRLVESAASLWSHDYAFGTVTHQNIGYLFPMGPFYWGAQLLHVPMWIAQRIWLGLLLFLAALGVRRCAEELGLARGASWAAALPYMLSPYILVNLDRTSAILLPWAGLGWMMVYTIRAARRDDWRHPALFALVVALVGGVNATSILMVAFAPVLYLLFAARTKEISWRRCLSVVVRIGVLSFFVSIWWIGGLWAEGKYGINILRFTESFGTVTYTSTSSEVFRGLGYWYFYGRDALQPWTLSSLSYVTGKFVPTASFLVPLVGFVAALCVRWRYRLLAVAITFVGIIVAVGSYPLANPTPIGQVFKFLALHTTVALAMRSTNRVIPIVILGLGLLTAAGFQSLAPRIPRTARLGFAGFVVIVFLAMLPLFDGKIIASNLTMPSTMPSYVTAAANELDTGSSSSNVLGLPGEDFAYYRFGAANDSIWPGITNRPWISSQVQLEGEPSSINLIRGLDSTFQNGIAVPSSIAPIARLLNVSSVLVQMNLQYERYASPLPSYMWGLLNPIPAGLSLVNTYGPRGNFTVSNGPYIDEATLGLPLNYKFPPQLAILKVANPRPLVRTESAAAPQIVAGNGEGLVTMAQLRLLNNDDAILFDGSESRAEIKSESQEPGAWLVLTDSNQRRLDTYGTLSATEGYVETSTEKPLVSSLSELTLPTFTNPPSGSQTVALMYGLKSVGASAYGNIITNNPEDQPFEAVDGLLNTAWTVAAFSPAVNQYFQMTALSPQTITKIRLIQPQSTTQNRFITRVGISVDGGNQYVRTLNASSNSATGQVVTIPPTHGATLRITILGDSDHDHNLPLASGVGFAEVDVAGFGPASRGLLLPTSLLRAAGPAAATDHLTIVTNRLRTATVPPRLDPELSLLRYVQLPDPRSFTVSGLANLNPAATNDVLDTLVGRHPGPGASITSVEGSSTLTGSINDLPWSAFGNNPNAPWESRFHIGAGAWLEANLNKPVTLTNFTMTIINDGYHMVPTALSVSNGTTTEDVQLSVTPAKPTGQLNTTQTLTIQIPALRGKHFRFTFTAVDIIRETDRVTGGVNFPPLAVTHIGIPSVSPGVTPTKFDTGCRSDLLKIDGVAIPIDIVGTTAAALNQNELNFTTCSPTPINLSSGTQVISSTAGYMTGININNVVLDSPSTTTPGPVTAIDSEPATWYGQSVVRSSVGPQDAGRWLVLAQSYAQGWHASVNGHDLGAPTLIDGASMGWLLPDQITGTESVVFTWTPEQTVLDGVLVSAAALFVILLMIIFDRPRRKRRALVVLGAEESEPEWTGWHAPLRVAPKILFGSALVVALAVSIYAIPILLGLAWLWTYRRRFGRWLSLAATLLVASGSVITVRATQSTIQRDISWPTHINYANTTVWLGIALWVFTVVGTSGALSHGESAVATERTAPPRDAPTPKEDDDPVSTDLAPRRGLNVPKKSEPSDAPQLKEVESIPLGGMNRTWFLLRSFIKNRHDPYERLSVLTEDSINQIVGKTPLFNRRVLDISDLSPIRSATLVERGAHVTTMRRQVPPTRANNVPRGASPRVEGELEFTPNHIPGADAQFDLVFATNVLSSVDDPAALLSELIRVTRVGGTLYIQNVMWHSLLGGRETSPWHLLSGRYARRRYTKHHGHEPFNRYGVNFFKMTPRQLVRLFHAHPEVAVFMTGPRFLPMKWGWTMHVPILRTLILQDVVIVAERHDR